MQIKSQMDIQYLQAPQITIQGVRDRSLSEVPGVWALQPPKGVTRENMTEVTGSRIKGEMLPLRKPSIHIPALLLKSTTAAERKRG